MSQHLNMKLYITIYLYMNYNYRLIHGLFHILLVISTRPWYQPLGLMTRAIWKRPCINLFITYFARADNMLLPRKQITCHSVISIKYVIISKYLLYYIIYLSFLTNYVCHIREFSNTIPLLHYSNNSKYIYAWR